MRSTVEHPPGSGERGCTGHAKIQRSIFFSWILWLYESLWIGRNPTTLESPSSSCRLGGRPTINDFGIALPTRHDFFFRFYFLIWFLSSRIAWSYGSPVDSWARLCVETVCVFWFGWFICCVFPFRTSTVVADIVANRGLRDINQLKNIILINFE